MKNLINYSFKIGVLFTIAIFYISCQNEDDLNLESNSQMIENPLYNITTINKNEINENLVVSRVLNEITKPSKSQLTSHSRLVSYENFNIVINDDYAKYLEKPDGSYHSYTFKAVDLDNQSEYKNLILSLKDDGTYKEILVNYYLTEDDLLSYTQTGIIDFDTNINSTIINEDSFIVDIYSKVLATPSTDNPNCIQFIFDGTTCSGSGHSWDQALAGECEIYNQVVSGTPPTQGPLTAIYIDGSCYNGGPSSLDNDEDYEDIDAPDDSQTSGGGNSDQNNDSDYDATDPDIHGNTVLAPILGDIGIQELGDQLNDILDDNDSYFF